MILTNDQIRREKAASRKRLRADAILYGGGEARRNAMPDADALIRADIRANAIFNFALLVAFLAVVALAIIGE